MSLTRPYVIVRTTNAGVFAGYLKDRDGSEVVLTESRRLWYWDGAATLSQLANDGTSKPGTCKFPAALEGDHIVLETIEILEVTARAQASIAAVTAWAE